MLVMLATVALAQDVGQPAGTTKKRDAVITGQTSAPAAGQCTAASSDGSMGYENQCPVGTCSCLQIANAKVKGSLAGKGTADVFITVDDGLVITPGGCTPIYGIANLTTKLRGIAIVETMNFAGASCPAPPIRRGKAMVSGAFGIQSSSISSTGFGLVTGTGLGSHAAQLKFDGAVTQ